MNNGVYLNWLVGRPVAPGTDISYHSNACACVCTSARVMLAISFLPTVVHAANLLHGATWTVRLVQHDYCLTFFFSRVHHAQAQARTHSRDCFFVSTSRFTYHSCQGFSWICLEKMWFIYNVAGRGEHTKTKQNELWTKRWTFVCACVCDPHFFGFKVCTLVTLNRKTKSIVLLYV